MPVSFSWTVTPAAAVVGGGGGSSGSSSPASELFANSPRDMELDPLTGDLADLDENGQQPWLYGVDGTASDLGSRVRTLGRSQPPDGPEIPGEFFLDLDLGLPLFGVVFRRGANLEEIRAMYRRCALETPWVAEVLRLEASLTDRELSVTFGVRAETGELIDATLTDTQAQGG